MSKIGIVRDGAIEVDKPVKIEFINRLTTTQNQIKIHYTAGLFSGNNNSELVILLSNPDINTYTAEYIRQRVLRWISDGLASSSVLTLNDYLGDLVVTQVGVVATQTTGQIIAAADSAAACAATPNIEVAIDTNNAAPLVGTGIYQVSSAPQSQPLEPVAAGSYALLIGVTQYFITVNDFSAISSVEVCPLLLDFVYNLRNLTNPVTLPNDDAISFAMRNNTPFLPGTTSYANYYSYQPGTAEPGVFDACNVFNAPNPQQITGNQNAMWPVGIINNATTNVPNFANEDVAFGLQLADSNVADFNNAQLFISFDLNANGGVVADATFVPFQIAFGDWTFAGSPTGGIPGLGDGTIFFSPGNTDPNLGGFDLFTGAVYLPAGQSLVGSANFTNGAFCAFNVNQGNINFVQEPNCPQ
tara:strand:+ start:1159 stop:2400 length:1242 start_codon:yes stop_codon:yes gene_type:complete